MSTNPALEAVMEQEKLFEAFENLMPFRVQDILLVSSLYDSFILREDGRLNEMLIGESYELNLQHVPRMPNSPIERIFLWQGNARILISIIKYVEDKLNVEHDTEVMGVPVMLVVEDNIRYYSSFLPVIYTELISQARRLISEGLNVAHKLVRMRARPKILLASNYEEAAELVLRYRGSLLGVVADVEFPRP